METLDSMEAEVLNEGLKKEDEMKVYNLSVIGWLLCKGSESTEAAYARTADALLYYCWRGLVTMMLFLQQLRMDDTVFGVSKTTTTKARVDEYVARIDQLRTCSWLRILNEYETEEVRRHAQHEVIYANAQARVADDEQLDASLL
jgi:hypothetical protein